MYISNVSPVRYASMGCKCKYLHIGKYGNMFVF